MKQKSLEDFTKEFEQAVKDFKIAQEKIDIEKLYEVVPDVNGTYYN